MFISFPSLSSSQVSLFGSLLIKPCQDNLSPVSHSPLYQFPSAGLFGYLPVTIRSRI